MAMTRFPSGDAVMPCVPLGHRDAADHLACLQVDHAYEQSIILVGYIRLGAVRQDCSPVARAFRVNRGLNCARLRINDHEFAAQIARGVKHSCIIHLQSVRRLIWRNVDRAAHFSRDEVDRHDLMSGIGVVTIHAVPVEGDKGGLVIPRKSPARAGALQAGDY